MTDLNAIDDIEDGLDDEEEEVYPGGPMTPAKLRIIAEWFDVYDKLGASYARVSLRFGLLNEDQAAELVKTFSNKGIQQDLRRWADELEEGPQNEDHPTGDHG